MWLPALGRCTGGGNQYYLLRKLWFFFLWNNRFNILMFETEEGRDSKLHTAVTIYKLLYVKILELWARSRKKKKGKKKAILRLKLASVSPGRVVEIQIAGPTARVASTAVQEAHFEDHWSRERESVGALISSLLGCFNHPGTTSGPFVERALSTLGGLCCSSPLGCRGAFIGRVSLLLLATTQLPGCHLEAVRLWDVLRVDLDPSTWRQNCGKKPSDALRVYLHSSRVLVQESRSYGGSDLGHQKH